MKTTESEEAQEQFWTILEFLNCGLCIFFNDLLLLLQ